MKYLITGATGHLGRLVVQELSKQVPINNIRLGVHTPAKATGFKKAGYELATIDYQNTATMNQAFQNIDVLIYILVLLTRFKHELMNLKTPLRR